MRRWELLFWPLLIFSLVILLTWLLADSPQNNPQLSPIKVNTKARLAASGSPLPAPADEDLVVKQQQFDGYLFNLYYDWDSRNWQLEFNQNSLWQKLRFIAKDNQFFFFNLADSVWDELDAQALDDQFKQLTDIEQFIFSKQQLDFFNQLAVERESDNCTQDPQSICAVWRAENKDDYQQILIYVNKQTRKIDQILTYNLRDLSQPTLVADYLYQPVDISAPDQQKTRYLK